MFKKFLGVLSLSAVLLMCSCSADGVYYGGYNSAADSMAPAGEEYMGITENGYLDPSQNPLSSFSLDSSSYAYTNLRRLINNNSYIPQDAVVIEQMLNYFNYSYKNETDKALSTTLELAPSPFNSQNHLALISVNSKEIDIKDAKNNFVFLIDTSGSMSDSNKLGLFQEAFKLLVNSVDQNDTVSIVTYASGVRVIAEGVNGGNKTELVRMVDELVASGSTNGSGGIQKAYELASKYFIKGGNNRVLLATDGDFNVGIRNDGELNDFISSKRETGVYLSVLGFGMGNTKHSKMNILAENGNGNAYYIDSLLEAKKVFTEELGSVLNTVAKDAKIQVEFNPEYVTKYRLIGYENKMMTEQEFEDNQTDAGEIGEGHTVIAIYEVELKDKDITDYILNTKLRYKAVNTNEDIEVVDSIGKIGQMSEDFKFASAVCEFALLLRNSTYTGEATYEHLISVLEELDLNDDYFKLEFLELVKKAQNNQRLNY